MDDDEFYYLVRRRNLTTIPENQLGLLETLQSWHTPAESRKGSVTNDHLPQDVLSSVSKAWEASRKSKSKAATDARVIAEPTTASDDATERAQWEHRPRHSSPDWSQDMPDSSQELPDVDNVPPSPSRSQSRIRTQPQLVQVMGHEMQDDDEEGEEDEPQSLPEVVNESMEVAAQDSSAEPLPPVSTPACGQGDTIIPDTVVKEKSPLREIVANNAQPKKRLMKPYAIESPNSSVPKRLAQKHHALGQRMPSTKQPMPPSSSNFVTSSIIPATCTETISKVAESSGEALAEDSLFVEDEITSQPDDAEMRDIESSPEPENDTVDDEDELDYEMPAAPAPLGRVQAPPIRPDKGPAYEQFCQIYPDYISTHNGSLSAFVDACTLLKYAFARRLLREYLFDDFIRATTKDYPTYVINARSQQEPLPLPQWFNNLRGPPLYSSMAVDRSNLPGILEQYVAEESEADEVMDEEEFEEPEQEEQPGEDAEEELEADAEDKEPEESIKPSSPATGTPVRPSTSVSTIRSTPSVFKESPTTQPKGPSTQSISLSPNGKALASPDLGILAKRKLVSVASAASTSPPASRYLDKLVPSSMPAGGARPKPRSAAEQARLREHFRQRKLSGKQAPSRKST